MSINVEKRVNGNWQWYCFLVEGADKPGHYGAAARAWAWAKDLVAKEPDTWRITEDKQWPSAPNPSPVQNSVNC